MGGRCSGGVSRKVSAGPAASKPTGTGGVAPVTRLSSETLPRGGPQTALFGHGNDAAEPVVHAGKASREGCEAAVSGVGSDHRDLENVFAASPAILRMIVENSPIGIIIVDPDSLIRFANAQAEVMFGWPRKSLLCQSIDVLVPIHLRGQHPQYRDAYFQDPQIRPMGAGREVFGLRRDGSEFPIEVGLNPIQVEGRAFVLCSVVDITVRRHNEALLHAKIEAEEASRGRIAFLARVSHELRTPLTGVLGMSAVLADTAMSPEQRSCVESLQHSADALLRTVNKILDFVCLEEGRVNVENVAFNARDVVQDVTFACNTLLAAPVVALVADVEDSVPCHMIGDPSILRQVLLHLVTNAIKHTACGTIALQLRAAPVPVRGPNVRMLIGSVRDTGSGIPPDMLGRLFRPFVSQDVPSRQGGGTGLGLTITKGLLELLGGSITVDSTPGKGSEFTFQLCMEVPGAECPYCSGIRPDDTPGRQRASSGGDHPPLHGAVLVVEDDGVCRRVLTALLGKLGCQVHAVDNGMEAVHAWKGQAYDLVLMDWEMPIMNGLEAAKEIRRQEAARGAGHIPIVGLSANVLSGDCERMLNSGMDAYISKPVDRRLLHSTLARWLAHSGDSGDVVAAARPG